MRFIQEKNAELEDSGSKLSIVVEFVAGKITDTIERMIALYRPDSLIVGTRGKQKLLESVGAALGAGVGSVSRCVIIHIDLGGGKGVSYVRRNTDQLDGEQVLHVPLARTCHCRPTQPTPRKGEETRESQAPQWVRPARPVDDWAATRFATC